MAEIDTLLVCDCARTMNLDPEALGAATGARSVISCHRLCCGEQGKAEAALSAGGHVLIACGQEAETFARLAEDIAATARLSTVDIRDRAGWTDRGNATPKQAALLAEALLERPPTPVKELVSNGVCLILGTGETALHAARRLADTLAVTCVLSEPPEDPVPDAAFDLVLGRLRRAAGAFAGFEVMIDGFAPLDPSGRGALGFAAPQDGARSQCDIILDLTGGTALFPAASKRDGYLRADPRDPVAVERVLFDAAGLTGTFEKPLHVRFHPEICVHSRARQTGCTRCLNVCPTGAIAPAGDTVKIDPDICAGCGACAAVCPTGAAAYDDPPVDFLFRRLRALASAYRQAGGTTPRMLFHDSEHGAEMIRLSARFGRGLPADVVPLEVAHADGVGHAELLCALGVGFSEALVLAGPATDRAALAPQIALADAILAGTGEEGRIRLIEPFEPEAMEDALRTAPPPPLEAAPILPLGGRREVTRLAATALAGETAAPLPLPDGAPYGAIVIDKQACTLCLACVSLCPVGALADSPDRPQVRLQESACVQCGICASACPEDAITLIPQLELSKAALTFRVLNEEEPFECIECGKPFGARSTIARIVEKLEGRNWMYTNSDNVRLIQMCDDCRVKAQYHAEASPFRLGARPSVRTAKDYEDKG